MVAEQDPQALVASPADAPAFDERPHVAVLFDRFGPYHHARLKAAGSRLRITGVETSNVDTTYAWDLVTGAEGFERLTLFSGVAAQDLSARRILNSVSGVLDKLNPQVVAIPGWHDRCSLAALRWCAKRGVPVVVMSESTAWDAERTWWKELLKRRVLRLCSSGLVGGSVHAEYLEQLGIVRKRIFFGYDVVDNDYFGRHADEARSRSAEARSKYGVPEHYFLASARFVEKKNLFRLIEAYARYRVIARDSGAENKKPEIWNLVLLGDGPLKPELCKLISKLSLQDSVLLPGFKQYGELPVYYGLASAFVHASTVEQWGLVVNEAMASGLPLLVSKRCGCAADLVKEGVNGFTFDPGDTGELAKLMCRISALAIDRVSMGRASQEIILECGLLRFASGLAKAVEAAVQTPRQPVKALDRGLLRMLLVR